MTKEALLRGFPGLPTIEIDRIASGSEILEGNEGDVHYIMTKENFFGLCILATLSVSGPEKDRVRFIEEIALELGEPKALTELPEIPGIHFAVWEGRRALRKLRRPKN